MRQRPTKIIFRVPELFQGPRISDIPSVAQTVLVKGGIPTSNEFVGIDDMLALRCCVCAIGTDPAIVDGVYRGREAVDIKSVTGFVEPGCASNRASSLKPSSASNIAAITCFKLEADSTLNAPCS